MHFKKSHVVLSWTALVLILLGGLILTGHNRYAFSPGDPLLDPEGCTVVVVGKDASVDGSVMTTHTCDCSMCDWTWRSVPAQTYKEGAVRTIYHISQYKTWPPSEGLKWDERFKDDATGVDIPQPKRTYAYKHGMFGYMNEHQLAIGESTIGSHPKMRNPTPSATFDITTLTLVAMERCKTAREAIQTMGSLAEQHGYGFHDDGEMLAVADTKEVWIFEIHPVGPLWTPKTGKPGAVWCAQRVPSDHVSFCPNSSRIGEIDLADKDNFMASSNMTRLAVDMKFWDPDSGEPFNWKKAYSPDEYSASSSGGTRVRLWRLLDLVAPSKKFSPDTPNMDLPFSVKPDKKVSVKDVMTILRDKFQGTPFDPVKGLQGGPFANPNYMPRPFTYEGKTYNTARTIGVNRAEYTTITQSRDWLPDPVGGIIWLCFGAQDTACYMPLYNGILDIPESFKIGDHWEFDRKAARWAFDYVDFHTLVVYSLAIQDVNKAIERWEDAALARTGNIDALALDLHKKDPDQATAFLTDYCINNADRVVDAWWDLGDDILVKYKHLWIYDKKERKQERIEYPEWWKKALVEYDKLVPQPDDK
ncbi:MAG: C69 family dipeptidase [Candidatus Aminicenantes bacterium]|nr:C69 family dipeptidase [Candidatus Aminicenantes bacterium]